MTAQAFTIFSYAAALFSLGLGLLGLIAPARALGLIGLQTVPGLAHSVSEVRATYGGVFIGASLYPLVSGQPHAFLTLSACWLLAGLTRLASMAIDRAATPFNGLSVAVELTVGAFVALPYLAAL
jgi:hypothetical protein